MATVTTMSAGVKNTAKSSVESRLAECAVIGESAIESRLKQLDREWTRGRAVQVLLGMATLGGAAAAYWFGASGLIVVAIAGLLLLQNGLAKLGFVSMAFKALGWRTLAERELERSMLKAIRGDFARLPSVIDQEELAEIARMEAEGGVVDGPEPPVPVNREAVREVINIVQLDCPEC